MSRNIVMFAVVAICGVPAFAAAQAAWPISVDQRVRVWTSAPEAISGRLTSVSADGLEISNESGAQLRVARPAVQRIEASRGVTTKGAGVGAARAGERWEQVWP